MCETNCGRDWSGEVVVCLNQRVTSDLPFFMRSEGAEAEPGEHGGASNQHGALFVHTDGGDLGVKPAEVAWWRYADSDDRYVWGRGIWVLAIDEIKRLRALATHMGLMP